ncbi:hypothetical protein JHK82_016127 [Glycine max]|nr:hypothetical protein JHK82_016127 [Glycine max]
MATGQHATQRIGCPRIKSSLYIAEIGFMQGNMVLKDFNIAEEAAGVNKAVTKSFTIVIGSDTLEIHLY